MPYIGQARWPVPFHCERKGCPTPSQGNHYHCGRCVSPDVTSMMGHYKSDDGKNWYFTCEEKDLGRSMSFDGEEGYFLTTEEYEELQENENAEEYRERVEELEAEVSNLRETVSQAYDSAHDLKYLLGNA